MNLFNIGKRPIKFDNGTQSSPPTGGFFTLRVEVTAGTMEHNGLSYAVGEVLSVDAPAGRTIPTLVTTGGASYNWQGMR